MRAEVDELLFQPSGWFVIDCGNARVPRVLPGSLTGALALCGQGRVATVVGRLRPEVVGVDVDAPGALGDLAVEHVRDWCRHRGLWHLVRPSGGGPGRAHVLIVPGVHRDALAEHVQAVRGELGLSATGLAVMRTLRPLSAPHRRTGSLSDVGDLTGALADLRRVLDPVPERVAARRAARRTAVATAGQGAAVLRKSQSAPVPSVPLSRPRRPLPMEWADYLARGREAVAEHGLDVGESGTRSLVELRVARRLVIAGYDAAQAWEVVRGAHPTAFAKARSHGERWWWVAAWNPAVASADAWWSGCLADRPTPTPGGAVAGLTGAAWDVLWEDWTAWDPRTRHTDREVLSVLLTRMGRVGSTRVPVPQRDLVQDCAIASRTTVRASLTRLRSAGYLTRAETYVPGTTDTAHTWSPGPRLTPPDGGGVSLIGPSRGTPPHPARQLPLTLRRALGLPAAHLAAHLPAAHDPDPATLTDLGTALGLLTPGQDRLTPRQTRTLTGHLRTLDHAGLAQVDEHGRWRATPAADTPHDQAEDAGPASAAADRVRRAGERLHQDVVARVHTERVAFRAAFDPATRAARWRRQQSTTLARQAKHDVVRRRAWWDGLPPADRAQRAAAGAAAFAALSPDGQDRRRRDLVARRARAGITERDRHAAWLTALSPADADHRTITRTLTYRARPDHERHHLAAAWAQQRADWHLPYPTRRTHPATQTTPAAAEDALLRRPTPEPDELILLDLETTADAPAHVTAG